MYRTCGEGIAALVGWSTLLRHIIVTAALARSISQNFDIVLDDNIMHLMSKHIGNLPVVGNYPDFLAPLFVMAVTALIAIGVQSKRLLVNLLNCSVMLLLLFCLVVGVFRLDFSNWSHSKDFFSGGALSVS